MGWGRQWMARLNDIFCVESVRFQAAMLREVTEYISAIIEYKEI